MAITGYTGVPGGGKSFALVQDVILPGIRMGRRVVSNVAGVDEQQLIDFTLAKWPDCEPGTLVTFDGSDALDPHFWPFVPGAGESVADGWSESVVHDGDLVVFDEVRTYWPRRGKFPDAIVRFLRKHRHHVDASGRSTDIVLASQVLADFNLEYRGCIERTFHFRKLGNVGLKKVYRWSMFEGSTQPKGEAVATGHGTFGKGVGDLYKTTHGDNGGVEVSVDKRSNVLLQPKVIGVLVLALAGAAYLVPSLFHMFHPAPGQKTFLGGGAAPAAATVAPVAWHNGEPDRVSETLTLGPGETTIASGAPVQAVGHRWRISGSIRTTGFNVVVLTDEKGTVRYESPSNFQLVDGRPVSGFYEGRRVDDAPFPVVVAAAPGPGGAFGILGGK